jgi:multidrug efflux pump
MMCGWMLKRSKPHSQPRRKGFGRFLMAMQEGYGKSLKWVLNHTRLVGLVLIGTIVLNVWMYITIPKTFFPEQDTGVLMGGIQADQSISFQAMRGKLQDFMKIIREDKAVDNVTGFTGGSRVNSGMMFITLKPRGERNETAQQVIDRLRVKLAKEPGANLFLMAVQDIRVGGRQANASYQYTLLSDDLAALREWEPKIRKALAALPELADVNSDQQDNGAEMALTYDRETMSRLGINVEAANSLLNNAFGQREISTIYQPMNQYKVVMEVDPRYTQDISALDKMFVINNDGKAIPLSYFASWQPANAPLSVNHQGLSAASTISFNLPAGSSLSEASDAINRAMTQLGVPSTVRGSFAGTAQVFQETMNSQVILILAAIATVYIVLGVLYESYVHPLTILSTLPSAGVGAAGAGAVRRAVQPDRAHRDHAIDRHREEKRHHDGRLRAGRPAQRQSLAGRGHLPGLPAAFSSDHDDHPGGAVWRAAAGDLGRRRLRAAPAAGDHHCRRPGDEPAADAVHHAGGLSVLRPPAAALFA